MTPSSSQTPAARCGALPSFNAARILSAMVSVLTPGRAISNIRNAPPFADLSRSGSAAHPASREIRAVADGVATELIGVGATIVLTRLLAAAERLAPGITIPCTIWQTVTAVSAARRGELLQAVQRLPVSALAPAVLHDALTPLMRHLMQPLPETDVDATDLLLGMACFAVLYEMVRQDPLEVTVTVAGRSFLYRLRQLRAVTTVLVGLHHRAEPADALSVSACQLHVPLCAPVSFGAWPPGAAAATASKAKAPPPKHPPGTSSRKMSSASRLGRVGGSVRRHRGGPGKGVVHTARSDVGYGGVAGVGSAGGTGGAGSDSSNKEAMFFSVPGSKPDHPVSPVHSDKVSSRVRVPAKVPAINEVDMAAARQTGSRIGAGPVPHAVVPLPPCLRFHHIGDAVRQIMKARFYPHPVRFCVHDRARLAFAGLFDSDHRTWVRAENVIAAIPIREDVRHRAHDPIVRYAGIGQLHRQPAKSPRPLGHDDLYVMATISTAEAQRLPHRRVDPANVLSLNHFRLIHYIGLQDRVRLLLAYAFQRCNGTVTDVSAGFLQVEHHEGVYSLEDPESDFVFSSDTLEGLVSGIERLSGWPLQSGTGALQLPRDTAPSGGINNLLVSMEDVDTAVPCSRLGRLERRTRFLQPVSFGAQGVQLLRTCFTFQANLAYIADADGMQYTLVFSPAHRDDGRMILNAQRGPGRELLISLGLNAGSIYSQQEITDVLEDQGYTHLPLADATPAPRVPDRLTSAEQPDEAPKIFTPLSSFQLERQTLRFVDHDGTEGELSLRAVAGSSHHFWLDTHQTPASEAFLQRIGLDTERNYTVEEIENFLYDDGFVQTPPLR